MMKFCKLNSQLGVIKLKTKINLEVFQLTSIQDLNLCINKVLVPPDGEGHHGVAVGHDEDGEDVLGDEDEGVIDTAPLRPS